MSGAATPILAITRRELFSYLLSPTGYVIAAVFVLFSALLFFLIGAVFGGGFNQGEPASMRLFFTGGIWVFLFIAPAVSMRTLSEEYRLGTWEMLMSCPVRERDVILGKFFGSWSYLALMLVPTLIFVVALELYGRPDYGELACGYFGMLLAGGAFLATGVLFSTLTSSQVLAYLATLFFWMILMLLTKGLPVVTAAVRSRVSSDADNAWVSGAVDTLSEVSRVVAVGDPQRVIADFAAGLLDTFNVVYFVAFIVVSLIAASVILRTRRMR